MMINGVDNFLIFFRWMPGSDLWAYTQWTFERPGKLSMHLPMHSHHHLFGY